MAQTLSLMCPLNEPGNIRSDETKIADTDNAEIRFEGSKRIIGDFRSGRRDYRYKCRFAGIGQTDQTYIRNQFQLDVEVIFFTSFAGSGKFRGLANTIDKVYIPLSSPAAVDNHCFLSAVSQVGQQLAALCIPDYCSGRQYIG